MTYWTTAPSPLGNLLLTSNGSSLTGLWTPRPSGTFDVEPDWIENSKEQPFRAATEQLTAYFAGKLKRFEIPLEPAGTPFQQRVWTELQRIPYGKTISYGELANRIGNSKASRAVGLANGSNPISIVIPCHRVIGSNGKLVGYGGGLDTKRRLLDFESRQLFW